MSAIAMYGAKTLSAPNPFTALLLMGVICAYSAIVGNGDNSSNLEPAHVDKYIQELIPCLETTYTSCMSTYQDNFLVWSHYADSHKGMVIRFDANAYNLLPAIRLLQWIIGATVSHLIPTC